MEELYPWIGACVGLVALGCVWAVMTGLKERRDVLNSLDMDYGISEDDDLPGFPLQSLVYVTVAVPALIYSLLLTTLIWIFSPLTDIQVTVAKGALLCLGLSALFGNLGRSLMYREATEGIGRSEHKKQLFGKYMVFLVLPETVVIHGLLISILGLVGSGALDGNFAPSPVAIDAYFQACVILGISAAAAIFVGTSFRRAPSLIESPEKFPQKIISTAVPMVINILGLAVAIWLMVDSGFFG
ncbi:MAG: hypothetical protein R6U17_08110 [Thermoplasmata archaeon]